MLRDAGEPLVFHADDMFFPTTPEEERHELDKSVELTERCWDRQSWLLPHLSTANVARDLDLLRAAVSEERLNFAGYSYSTFLGLTYANLYPHRVGAMVLDGSCHPPTSARWRRGRCPPSSDIASAEVLQAFFDLCARAGRACPFAAGGHPRAKFEQLLARVREDPIELPVVPA